MAELAKREMDSDALIRSVWWTLRIVFGLVPIVAGLDKFFNLLVTWEKYLSGMVERSARTEAHA